MPIGLSMRPPSTPPLRKILPQQLLGLLQLPRPKPLLGPLLHRFAPIVFHARLGVHLARDLLGHFVCGNLFEIKSN